MVRKNIERILIVIGIIFIVWIGKSYGIHSTNLNERMVVANDIYLEEDALDVMKQSFDYNGELNDPMKIKTTISVKKQWFGKYKVSIGKENDRGITPTLRKYVSKENLKDIYGYEEDKGKTTWDAILIVSPITSDEKLEGSELEHASFVLCINEVYTGENLEEGKNRTVEKNKPSLLNITVNTKVDNVVKTVQEILKSETAQRFAKNPLGFTLTYIYDGLKYLLGDSALSLAHAITFSDTEFVYSYDQLSTEEYSSIDQYTNVGKYKAGNKSRGQKQITIKQENKYEDEEYRKFSDSTKIPVITIDLYNIAADNIEFFDIDFFNVDKSRHHGESAWRTLRDFTSTVIHVTVYAGAAILLILLIINGIQIVGHSLDNPEAKAESMKKLRKFAWSLFLLVGTILIMTLCTNASNLLLNKVKVVEKSSELPIRVNVEEADYSFSTNFTGYFRYMASIEGIHNYREKGMYVLIYIAIAWVNLALAVFMTFRTFIMMILAMLGPILAVGYSFNLQGKMRYTDWIKAYAQLAFVSIFFAILYRVIFEFTF